MDQVIAYDKSLHLRLQEYEEMFSGLDNVPYSKLQSTWAYYLELTMDPNGWQAVWKLSRLACESLSVPYPTVVLIYVLDIDFSRLLALVRVLAVQDDICLPEKHHVPLVELWPTKEQDKTIALNLSSTANVLDMLRFFYIHLVMPWDEDEDVNDWKSAHLSSRLRLYYDLKNGKIPKTTAEHIYALLNEARRLNKKRRALESVCDEFDSDIEPSNEESDGNVMNLIEINVRLIEIQNEVNLLENEVFRQVIVKRQKGLKSQKSSEVDVSRIWLIFKKGKANEYIRFIQNVEQLYPDSTLTFSTDFMEKLESAIIGETMLLSPNQHIISDQGALIEDFIIKGIGDNTEVKLVSDVEDVMLDCVGDASIIENLTIESNSASCAILVRKGKTTIRKSRILGIKSQSDNEGILVLSGAELTLESCEVSNYLMAIVGNSNSKITLKGCQISGANVGFKIFDDCQVELIDVEFKDCRQYGILLETEREYPIEKGVENFEALNGVPHVRVENVRGINNSLANLMLREIKIKATGNLFANPDSDPTILESSSEDEMDTGEGLNSTVLENGI
ncbi:protein nessun dorma [Cylas formicarius]|uniref:protein nessun dorma n=1 Tax=Cylas formicarius TaxID=197179 RepID=UPI0029587F51|nr:protein nessun dorma [Cylas formicarius]